MERRFSTIANKRCRWHFALMAVGPTVWRAIEYLPIAPFLVLAGYHVARVDPYPSRIAVTQRPCSDPENNGRLTFRGETFCVTSAEAEKWNTMWRNEYYLMGAFAICAGISLLGRRLGQRHKKSVAG